jgi:hypothetical protein
MILHLALENISQFKLYNCTFLFLGKAIICGESYITMNRGFNDLSSTIVNKGTQLQLAKLLYQLIYSTVYWPFCDQYCDRTMCSMLIIFGGNGCKTGHCFMPGKSTQRNRIIHYFVHHASKMNAVSFEDHVNCTVRKFTTTRTAS